MRTLRLELKSLKKQFGKLTKKSIFNSTARYLEGGRSRRCGEQKDIVRGGKSVPERGPLLFLTHLVLQGDFLEIRGVGD